VAARLRVVYSMPIGNAEDEPFQLDVYDEIMDALPVAGRYGLQADDDAWGV
jgi:hypothetical protein